MKTNKFNTNSNNINNHSTLNKLLEILQLNRSNSITKIIEAKFNNKPLNKQLLNEIFQIDPKILRLNREMMKQDHSNLIKDNLNNKSLLFTQFYQFSEMYDRNQHHSIADHNEEVKKEIINYVNSIGEEINYKPEIKSIHSNNFPVEIRSSELIYITHFLFKLYNQLVFAKANETKENYATILSDPERPSKINPVVIDHEHIAKLYFAYKFGIKAINCFQGRGSPDLLVSTRDLKKLGIIDSAEKGYLYADFKTGSHKTLGYDQKNGDHAISNFTKFIDDNLNVDLLLVDIHPYTNNINPNNIDQYEKLIKYLIKCKDILKNSKDDLIKNKKILFFDSNIPKVNIDDYYDKLADLNGIDPEVFDLFKELIEGYIDYLEKSKNNDNNIDHIRNQSINDSDLSNAYIKNDAGIYVPQHLENISKNRMVDYNSNDINNSVAKNVALTIKYMDTRHLTEEELNDFFSE